MEDKEYKFVIEDVYDDNFALDFNVEEYAYNVYEDDNVLPF